MHADVRLIFDLMGDWKNDNFSLTDGVTIVTHPKTIKVYSFNIDMFNQDQRLPELDLCQAYLQWYRSPSAKGYVCEMMTDNNANYIKEYPLDSMKVSGIEDKNAIHIWHASVGDAYLHIFLKRLV
jgi:hypothetical protein